MKLIIFLPLLITSLAFSQIKEMNTIKKELIGQINDKDDELVSLQKWEDNTIVIFYKDLKYQRIIEFKNFSFKDEAGAFDYLYNTLLDGIKSKENFEKSLELPDDILRLKFYKKMGKGYVDIWVQSKATGSIIGEMTWMDETRLNQLFGKELPTTLNNSQSKWETLTMNFSFTLYYRFVRIDGVLFFETKIMRSKGISGISFTVKEGKELALNLDNGDSLTLYNYSDSETCTGCGSVGLNGSSGPGINLLYELSNEYFEMLKNNNVISMKLATDDETLEHDLKEKKQREFKSILSEIK